MKGFCPLCNRALRAYAENPSGFFFPFFFLTATKDSDVFQTEKTETEEGLFSFCICWEKPGKVLRV